MPVLAGANVQVLWSDDLPLAGYRFGDFDGDGRTDVFRISGSQWQFSSGGAGPWQNLPMVDSTPIDNLRFGDFDGDGITDVFSVIAVGGTNQWRWSRSGRDPWQNLAADPTPLTELRFGDFDGDGRTDVFSLYSIGGTYQWRFSPGGTGGWVNLATDPTPLANLRFGDFDGDNRTDVFSQLSIGGSYQWRFSSGGAGAWQNLLIDPTPLHDLRFGDFDRDGRTDVFNALAIGGTYQWRYSSGGVAGWQNLAADPTAPADLRFGDFNGDRWTDVFSISGGQFRYSPSGTGGWIYLSPTPSPTVTPPWSPVSDLRFGDFDGDNRTDVFRAYGSQWQFSSGGLGSWQNLATDSLPLTDLRFSDPYGDARDNFKTNPYADRRTDIFSVSFIGGTNQWRFSAGGAGSWQNLSADPLPLTDLRFGDFNGDGITDVFSLISMGGTNQWRYSPSGTGAWINLASDPTPLHDLRFGDFDGDGRTDVFSVVPIDGAFQWRFSPGGTGAWVNLATDSTPLHDLRFGDFDGDGRTDVFSLLSIGGTYQWRYSSGGTGAWQNLASDPASLHELRFGDFDGDNRTDVFRVGTDGRWRYSSGGQSGWILLGPPQVTVTPTYTPWPPMTVTPWPTPWPTHQPGCTNIVVNGDMERDQGWVFGQSPLPGKYVGAKVRNGLRAIQLGNPPNSNERPTVSYSSVRQLVTIPANASTAELRWWHMYGTEQGVDANPSNRSSRQEVILLTPHGGTLKILQRVRRSEGSWQPDSVDLTEFIGQSFYIYFNVYTDGSPARTWMYLDDVTLDVCGHGGHGPQPYTQPYPQAAPQAAPQTAPYYGPQYPPQYGPQDGQQYGPQYGPQYPSQSAQPQYPIPYATTYASPSMPVPQDDSYPRYSSGSFESHRKAFAVPTFTPTFTPSPTPAVTDTPTVTPTVESEEAPAVMPEETPTPETTAEEPVEVEALSLAPVAAPLIPPDAISAVVTRVIDGETVEAILNATGSGPAAPLGASVRYTLVAASEEAAPAADAEGGTLIRYAGIDAASLDTEQGQLAAEANRLLVEGAVVYLEIVEQEGDESDDAIDAYVFLADGTLVNAVMVAAGHAVISPTAADGPYEDFLRQAQSEAQAATAGIWDLTLHEEDSDLAAAALPAPDALAGLTETSLAGATAMPAGGAGNCVELVNNGSFEATGPGWNLTGSQHAPAYEADIVFGESSQSLRLGNIDQENSAGVSAADQTVFLPEDAASIVLSFRYYPVIDGEPGPGDLQFVDIYNAMTGQFAGRALGVQQNDARWLAATYDLTSLAGQPVRIVFAVNNDDAGGRTAMYVDNVSILACPAAGGAIPSANETSTPASPTVTVTPANAPLDSDLTPALYTSLTGRETDAAPAGAQKWLGWLFTGAVMLGVLGMIGFGVLVIRNTFQPPNGS